jgi:hypothetical protein
VSQVYEVYDDAGGRIRDFEKEAYSGELRVPRARVVGWISRRFYRGIEQVKQRGSLWCYTLCLETRSKILHVFGGELGAAELLESRT